VRAVLDTSALIDPPDLDELEAAISAASLAELHLGVLVAPSSDERARRLQRLAAIEAAFDPLPIDASVAREWGRLSAALRHCGGKPRRRTIDLAIAATANVHGVALITRNPADLELIADLVDLLDPGYPRRS